MQSARLTPRWVAFLLAAALSLPPGPTRPMAEASNPAFGLRTEPPTESGLEEDLGKALSGKAPSSRKTSNRLEISRQGPYWKGFYYKRDGRLGTGEAAFGGPYPRVAIDFVLNQMRGIFKNAKGRHFVDIGVGPDLWVARQIQKVFPESIVDAVDIFEQPDPKGRKGIGKRIQYTQAVAEDTKLASGSYDTVIATFSMDYYEDVPAATLEMHRLLKEEGKAILLLHHPKSYLVKHYWPKWLGSAYATKVFYEGIQSTPRRGSLGKAAEFLSALTIPPGTKNRKAFMDEKIRFADSEMATLEQAFSNLFVSSRSIRDFFGSRGFRVGVIRILRNEEGPIAYGVVLHKVPLPSRKRSPPKSVPFPGVPGSPVPRGGPSTHPSGLLRTGLEEQDRIQRVLVAHGYYGMRKLFSRLQGVPGIQEVVYAHTGEEAIRLLKQTEQPFDLIIAQGGLPRKNGIELYQWVREKSLRDKKDQPVQFVLVSGGPNYIHVAERLKEQHRDEALYAMPLLSDSIMMDLAERLASIMGGQYTAQEIYDAMGSSVYTSFEVEPAAAKKAVSARLEFPRLPYDVLVVVEDEPSTMRLLEYYLSSLGLARDPVQLKTFFDGKSAMEFLQKETLLTSDGRPRIFVVTNYQMPQMDGPALIRAIRALPQGRELPVLLYSGSENYLEEYEAQDPGTSHLLLTPGDLIDFCNRISAVSRLEEVRKRMHRDGSSELMEMEQGIALDLVSGSVMIERLSRETGYERDVSFVVDRWKLDGWEAGLLVHGEKFLEANGDVPEQVKDLLGQVDFRNVSSVVRVFDEARRIRALVDRYRLDEILEFIYPIWMAFGRKDGLAHLERPLELNEGKIRETLLSAIKSVTADPDIAGKAPLSDLVIDFSPDKNPVRRKFFLGLVQVLLRQAAGEETHLSDPLLERYLLLRFDRISVDQWGGAITNRQWAAETERFFRASNEWLNQTMKSLQDPQVPGSSRGGLPADEAGLEERVDPNAWETPEDILRNFPALGRGTARQLLQVRERLPGGRFGSMRHLEEIALHRKPVDGFVVRGIGRPTWESMRRLLFIAGDTESSEELFASDLVPPPGIPQVFLRYLAQTAQESYRSHAAHRQFFEAHDTQSRRLIKQVAGIEVDPNVLVERAPQGSAVVLGVGLGRDIPLLELLLAYDEVVLADLDVESVRETLWSLRGQLIALGIGETRATEILQRAKPRIVDVTGIAVEFAQAVDAIVRQPSLQRVDAYRQLAQLFENFAQRQPWPLLVDGSYDLVVSSMLMDTLEQTLRSYARAQFKSHFTYLRPEDDQFLQEAGPLFQYASVVTHAAHLAQLVKPGGKIYFSDASSPALLERAADTGEVFMTASDELLSTRSFETFLQVVPQVQMDYTVLKTWGPVGIPPPKGSGGVRDAFYMTALELTPISAAPRGTTEEMEIVRPPSAAATTEEAEVVPLPPAAASDQAGLEEVALHELVEGDQSSETQELMRRYSAYKYGSTEATKTFAQALVAAVTKWYGEAIRSNPDQWVVTTPPYQQESIPSSATFLSQQVAEQLGLRHVHTRGKVARVGMTPYRLLPANERFTVRREQEETLYVVPNDDFLRGKHVLLIDDMVTTGATVQSVMNALLQRYKAASVTVFSILLFKGKDPAYEAFVNNYLVTTGDFDALATILNSSDFIIRQYAAKILLDSGSPVLAQIINRLFATTLEKLLKAQEEYYRGTSGGEGVRQLIVDRLKALSPRGGPSTSFEAGMEEAVQRFRDIQLDVVASFEREARSSRYIFQTLPEISKEVRLPPGWEELLSAYVEDVAPLTERALQLFREAAGPTFDRTMLPIRLAHLFEILETIETRVKTYQSKFFPGGYPPEPFPIRVLTVKVVIEKFLSALQWTMKALQEMRGTHETEQIDLASFIEDQFLPHLQAQYGGSLHYIWDELGPSSRILFDGSPIRLWRLLWNLSRGALAKERSDHLILRITTSLAAQAVQIRMDVEEREIPSDDLGVLRGIFHESMEDLERNRFDPDVSLAVAQGIVQAFGGSLEITRGENHRALYVATLPIRSSSSTLSGGLEEEWAELKYLIREQVRNLQRRQRYLDQLKTPEGCLALVRDSKTPFLVRSYLYGALASRGDLKVTDETLRREMHQAAAAFLKRQISQNDKSGLIGRRRDQGKETYLKAYAIGVMVLLYEEVFGWHPPQSSREKFSETAKLILERTKLSVRTDSGFGISIQRMRNPLVVLLGDMAHEIGHNFEPVGFLGPDYDEDGTARSELFAFLTEFFFFELVGYADIPLKELRRVLFKDFDRKDDPPVALVHYRRRWHHSYVTAYEYLGELVQLFYREKLDVSWRRALVFMIRNIQREPKNWRWDSELFKAVNSFERTLSRQKRSVSARPGTLSPAAAHGGLEERDAAEIVAVAEAATAGETHWGDVVVIDAEEIPKISGLLQILGHFTADALGDRTILLGSREQVAPLHNDSNYFLHVEDIDALKRELEHFLVTNLRVTLVSSSRDRIREVRQLIRDLAIQQEMKIPLSVKSPGLLSIWMGLGVDAKTARQLTDQVKAGLEEGKLLRTGA